MGLYKYSFCGSCALRFYLIPTCYPIARKRGGSITLLLAFQNNAVGDFSPRIGIIITPIPLANMIMMKSFCSRVRLPDSYPITDTALLKNLNQTSWILCAYKIKIISVAISGLLGGLNEIINLKCFHTVNPCVDVIIILTSPLWWQPARVPTPSPCYTRMDVELSGEITQ